MHQAETPTLLAMNYASTAYAGDDWRKPLGGAWADPHAQAKVDALVAQIANKAKQQGAVIMPNLNQRRLVQVFIADPNENIPVDSCLLYKGEQRLTDLTDQELFFEIDIKSILAAHNEKRVKIVDKAVKERTEYLEAARVRDLKMVVATLATFSAMTLALIAALGLIGLGVELAVALGLGRAMSIGGAARETPEPGQGVRYYRRLDEVI